MLMKDRIALETWVRARASLGSVLDADRYGLVDNERFTARAVRFYETLWRGSAWHFECPRQDRMYAWGGATAINRSILRCQKILRALGWRGADPR